MKEINKHILQQAIQELPEYTPPGVIWDGIEEGLLVAEQDDLVSETIRELPQYAPPAQLWEAIEIELESPEVLKSGKIVPLNLRRIIGYAAAAAGLAFGIYWMMGNQSNAQITYSEEIIDETLLANDWNADEADFELVLEELEQSDVYLQIPEIQQLRLELAELNDAKTEIEAMMEQYGADGEIVEQIREIELERTDVIKKLAAFI